MVRDMLIHVIGQISYKKGCLEKVVEHLKGWENEEVVRKAIEEILLVHIRYKNFSAISYAEARAYIEKEWHEIL